MTEIGESSVVEGRYRILHWIGSGGMADVWCAQDTHLGRRVALKLLYRRFAQDKEFVERFRREASAAAGLQHPSVVGVYDRGEFNGTYYIVMEYCEGETLKSIINREAPLPPVRAIKIAKQILVAARFAHRRGVIHRDLKPHNVILGADDNVKVTDFGIARAGASEITEVGAIMGTAQYLSPEQAQGSLVTAASDLYSIGIVLFEMLTGSAPFEGDSAVAIALKHVSEPPPSPRAFLPAIPPALEAVVMKALAKDPTERYVDADSFIRALDAAEAALSQRQLDTESTATFAPVRAPSAETALAASTVPVATSVEPAPVSDMEPFSDMEVVESPPPPASGETPEPPGPRRRRWLWVLSPLAFGTVLLLAYLLLHTKQVTVPVVQGQTLASARAELEHAGFKVDIRRRTDPAPVDTVIDQVPAAGKKADERSTVTVIASNGPSTVKVPDVIGIPQEDAKRRVRGAGLKPKVKNENSTKVPEGDVIRSDPGTGTAIERGSAVMLVVSSGPAQVEVPNVVGETQDDAVNALREKRLNVVVREKASNEPAGTVVSQTPSGSQQVDEGSTVTIFVSNGKLKEVPGVTGLSQADAASQLDGAGFSVSVRTRDTDQPDEDGTVLSQSPTGGAQRREGSTVTITVGAFVPPPGGP